MEPSEIVNVLARASELQAKIDGAIRRASLADTLPSHRRSLNHDNFDDDDDAEDEERSFPDVQKLKAIRHALLDLQDHLDSLQALQKRQKFEREDLLVELEDKRKLLIKRLRDYNGSEWEIVQEAHAFVGEPVQTEEDLMLPPYQSSVRDVHVLGEGGSFGGLSKRRPSLSRRASLASRPEDEEGSGPKQVPEVSKSLQPASEKPMSNETPFSGFVFGLARLATRVGEVVRISAKSALVIASVIFTLSQLESQLRKWSADRPSNSDIRIRSPRRQHIKLSPSSKSSGLIIQDESCPPGKVLLVQDGIQKCFVKERIEAPFKEVVKQPDASYGYG
ncbi:hypothetical protein GOP47_0007825 [Adiantum capillus-veneris]|uniref:Plastid division protein PDV2 n=1 Tax=Adiantum capillus-veneris TaxID=13818 RepID=A0A9D4V066_ADICA|nr:hypothetical protein GOP47_0007043 [Adiantum capillus-veneris]KAI5078001.1 hypothetical protein GOP47_0007825 [Adiantum capillus-veneris]